MKRAVERRILSRRALFALGGSALAAGGLGLAVRSLRRRVGAPIDRASMLSPSAFVAMSTDGLVHVWIPKTEMGQGVHTGLAQIIADALDAAFADVVVHDAANDPRMGSLATIASSSVRTTWELLSSAGATLREVFVEAAAEVWAVDATQLTTLESTVSHPDGRRLAYRDLLEVARPSAALLLRRHPARRGGLWGTSPRRLDIPEKVTGAPVFGIDVALPGQEFATLARVPRGVRIVGFDASDCGAVRCVLIRALNAVAVLAPSTYGAMEGRRRLRLETVGEPSGTSSSDLEGALRRALTTAGESVVHGTRPAHADLELEFEFPFVAHQAMEPLNCTIRRLEGRIEVWAPTQDPARHADIVAEVMGVDVGQVTVHRTMAGGGFGRRAEGDEVREAAWVALHARCVQLLWSREEDLQLDSVRPASAVRCTLALDGDRVTACALDVASAALDPEHDAGDSTDGLGPGVFPDIVPAVTWRGVLCQVRTGIWRSVAHSTNAYVKEHMVDVVARHLTVDPLQLRRGRAPRERAVVDTLLAHAGRAMGPRGVASHACFESFVAHLVELDVRGDRPRILRVIVAVDCGDVVHPDLVRQQLEGGTVFGLTAALHSRVTYLRGASQASNFGDQPILRFAECPPIETLIVPSTAPPGGVGEVGVPTIAPALANALLAAGFGPQVRLPIDLARLSR